MVLRDRLGDAADSVLRDLRFAWRALLRSPAFTLAAIASLAIGIGATTAVFSLADAVLLRPLPLPDPERLVEMIAVFPDGHRQTNLEPEAFDVLRREGVSTAEVFAQAFDRVGLRTVGDAAAPVDVLYVSGKYFDALGAGAVQGRVLREQDDRARVQPTAVLNPFWDEPLRKPAGCRRPGRLGRRVDRNDRRGRGAVLLRGRSRSRSAGLSAAVVGGDRPATRDAARGACGRVCPPRRPRPISLPSTGTRSTS